MAEFTQLIHTHVTKLRNRLFIWSKYTLYSICHILTRDVINLCSFMWSTRANLPSTSLNLIVLVSSVKIQFRTAKLCCLLAVIFNTINFN